VSEANALEVVLRPGDRETRTEDTVWSRDLSELHRGLRAYDVDVRDRVDPAPAGHKGAASEILVALAGSGAVGAAMAVLQSWLSQRSSRTMAVSIVKDGREEVYEVRAEGVSQEAVRDALLAALGAEPGPDGAAPVPEQQTPEAIGEMPGR
jgi:hypothetical protein